MFSIARLIDFEKHRDVVNMLCAVGVTIAVFQFITFTYDASEKRDWLYYYSLGAISFSYVLMRLLPHFFKPTRPFALIQSISAIVVPILALYGATAAIFYLTQSHTEFQVAAWCVALFMLRPSLICTPNEVQQFWGNKFIYYLFCMVIFSGLISFIDINNESGLSFFPVSSLIYFLITLTKLALATLLTIGAFYPRPPKKLLSPKVIRIGMLAGHVIAVLALFFLFFRTESLFNHVSAHHWKAIVEPAISIKEGGWLLWDTPAQYGFLLILVIALFPAENTWQVLYLVNGCLLALTASLMFFILFKKFNSFWGYFFSLIVTISSMDLIQYASGAGYRICPSGGALRFVWLYILLTFIAYHTRANNTANTSRIILKGTIIWLLGVLWSFESAVYITFTWFPCLMVLWLARDDLREGLSLHKLIKCIVKSLLTVLSTLLIFSALLSAYYLLHIGKVPDYSMFAIYVLAYKDAFGSIWIQSPTHAVFLLTTFGMVVFLLAGLARSTITNVDSLLRLGLLSSIAATLWAVSSYFVGRSHINNIINLLPIITFSLTLIFVRRPTLNLPPMMGTYFSIFMMCLYSTIIATPMLASYTKPIEAVTIAQKQALSPAVNINQKEFWQQLLQISYTNDITTFIADAPKEVIDLMEQAQFKPHSPLLVLAFDFDAFLTGDTQGKLLLEDVFFHTYQVRPWILPNTITGFGVGQNLKPNLNFDAAPLMSPEAYQKFAERRAERMCEDGWIIEPITVPLERYPWIKNAIDKYYRQAASFENAEYRLRKFERLKSPPCKP